MNEITIGGYTLEELKKVQAAVRKDASKIISEAIDAATVALDEILSLAEEASEEDLDPDFEGYAEALEIAEAAQSKINEIAKVAEKNLDLANTVSTVSGVEYYLPYSCDWSSDGYYYKLECAGLDPDRNTPLSNVIGSLEDMEYQSREWNQSTC